ncbi:glycosyltransferase family 39 protein [Burkholderiaceae bacterium FT117]|uniref:glycosyltransferase family 39 protein n=1 Tax=Zeimonas sediminis TaxID=2944268 RepID=UPI002342C9E1|nr:glycosyltransferase family 39 protein [Zeimonas sediminis]MCM5570171.1 glycosyltransferase family 39 protein [Zeimonas sediminis]
MTSRLDRLTSGPDGARRFFVAALLVLTALRAALAAVLPFTSDEAYFTFWGLNPDWGFYDHPPMIGWWLAPLSSLSLEPFVLRLPALAAPPLIALLAVAALRWHGEALAWNAGSLTLLVPLNAWNVAITTDIPLMVFSALTVVCYLRAQRSGRAADFLLAGLMLAGALMSKYFAGLLAIAIFAHSVWRPERRRVVGLLWVVLGSLPAAAIQIAWNAQHCWPNVMFNLVNRHDNAGLSWQTPLLFAISAVYVLTPAVAWRLLRGRADAGAAAARAAGGEENVRALVVSGGAAADARALRWLALVPFAIFALLSPVKTIGLHWLASFVLPAVLAFALLAGRRAMARGLAVALGIAVAHWLLIAVLVALPTDTFRNWKGYPGLVMTVHVDELARELAPWRGRYAIASSGYSPAVTLGHGLREYVFVFGPGSSHARHDDILTDVRKLAGRDILIVRKDDRYTKDDYDPYFERVEYRTLALRGATFHLIEGHGFRYEAYRDTVLDEIRRRWYAVPAWLPSGPCYFCDRYFPERACHRSGP